MIAPVGSDVVLPTLRLQIAQRLGCELAARNLAGDRTAGMEQCQMHYPALLERLRQP
jgi:hypothetical protein